MFQITNNKLYIEEKDGRRNYFCGCPSQYSNFNGTNLKAIYFYL